MQRLGVIIVLILSLLLFSFAGCTFGGDRDSLSSGVAQTVLAPDDLVYTNQPISIPDAPQNMANFRQVNASVSLFAEGGELYFFFEGGETAPKATGRLGVLRNGEMQIFQAPPKNFSQMIVWEGFAYYSWFGDNLSRILCKYNMESGEITEIAAEGPSLRVAGRDFCMTPQGVMYYVTDHDAGIGLPIRSGEVGAPESVLCDYTLGERNYYATWYFSGDLSYYDASGAKESVPLAEGKEWFIPCADGLLAMNITNGTTVHYINSAGEVTELFADDCKYGVLSVNCWGDYVFVSIQRYDRYKDGALPKLYENDTQSGTYRIDLRDYSTEKISEHAYDGLFIFSNNEIFACDRFSNVHKLDFDGNHLMDIVSAN